MNALVSHTFLTLFPGGGISGQQKIQKSTIILEDSRHPNFMNSFEYGKVTHNKSFPKRIGPPPLVFRYAQIGRGK